MKRLPAPGLLLPTVLAVAGVLLIVVGQLQVGEPGQSLPPIGESQVAVVSPSAEPSLGAAATSSLSRTCSFHPTARTTSSGSTPG